MLIYNVPRLTAVGVHHSGSGNHNLNNELPCSHTMDTPMQYGSVCFHDVRTLHLGQTLVLPHKVVLNKCIYDFVKLENNDPRWPSGLQIGVIKIVCNMQFLRPSLKHVREAVVVNCLKLDVGVCLCVVPRMQVSEMSLNMTPSCLCVGFLPDNRAPRDQATTSQILSIVHRPLQPHWQSVFLLIPHTQNRRW